MGKHERETIEALERSVCSILNGAGEQLAADHPWAGHDQALSKRIANDNPGYQVAAMTGNSYATPGDVDLTLIDGTTLNLELKASGSLTGRGTAANIGQNSLTEYGLVPGAESWSDFRSRSGFDERVIQILDKHPAAKAVAGKEKKGGAVKAAGKNGDEAAWEILEEVRAVATVDRSDYLAYLSNFEFDEARVRLLVFAVLTGNHRRGQIQDLIESGMPLTAQAVPANYAVYFSNRTKDGDFRISKLDNAAVVKFLSVRDLRIVLGNGAKATSHIQGKLGGDSVSLLNFILHWKNVSLGIKTPCINIFLGDFIKRLVQ